MRGALALLLDLDGVLRQWPADDHALERSHGLPLGSIRQTAFEPSLLHRAVIGDISDEQWRSEVVARLRTVYPTANASAAVALWSASPGQVEASTLQVIKRVPHQVAIVLVTNATTRLATDLATLQLGSLFAEVVSSSRIGAAKPDEKIFRAALDAAECSAERALYVDDSAVNITAAERLGLRVHRFTGAVSLQHFLKRNGVL